jgi:hypothetical protein
MRLLRGIRRLVPDEHAVDEELRSRIGELALPPGVHLGEHWREPSPHRLDRNREHVFEGELLRVLAAQRSKSPSKTHVVADDERYPWWSRWRLLSWDETVVWRALTMSASLQRFVDE